jgi:hypothetical protein
VEIWVTQGLLDGPPARPAGRPRHISTLPIFPNSMVAGVAAGERRFPPFASSHPGPQGFDPKVFELPVPPDIGSGFRLLMLPPSQIRSFRSQVLNRVIHRSVDRS